MNHFSHMKTYPDASFRDVVRPNADTLYSTLWFDVGKEPLILTLPDTAGRYHVVPIMDMWTEVFATLGTRTTGNDGGTVALVGPHWQGGGRKSVVEGKSVSVRVDLGGRRINKKKKQKNDSMVHRKIKVK